MSGSKKRVQSTNDSSILSKYSMVKAGYFKDEFLQYFVTRNARRSPLINRGYYVRMRTVNNMLRTFLTSKAFIKKQVISLGAGFDTSFFRFNAEGLLHGSCRFYEVDYPEVVKIKKSFIKSEPCLHRSIGTEKSPKAEGLHTDSYTLVGCNLKDLTSLENILLNYELDTSCATLLLSEVVLCYLDAKSSSRVINWAASLFSSAVFISYEQVFPDDPFGVVMMKHFLQVGSPLRSIDEFPTPQAQRDRYKKQGWDLVKYQNMVQFYESLSSEDRKRVQQLEPFDEFEEWDLKCFHYVILAAFKGDCKNISQNMFSEIIEKQEQDSIITNEPAIVFPSPLPLATQNNLQRYGHSATLLSSGDVVVIGGFGERNNKHMRLKGINILRNEAGIWRCADALCDEDNSIGSRMFHSSTLLKDNSILLFGGRESPNKPYTTTCLLKFEQDKNCLDPKSTLLSDVKSLTSEQYFETSLSTISDRGKSELQSRSDGVFSGRSLAGCGFNTQGFSDKSDKVCTLIVLDSKGFGPSPRWRHTATRLDHEREKIFIFGGRTPTQLALGDCYIFSIQDNKWEQVELQGEHIVPRHSHTACLWSRHVILAGGMDENCFALSLLQAVNTVDFTLETLAVTPSLRPRYSHTSHIINDSLILIGGTAPNTIGNPFITLVELTSLTSSSLVLPVCPGHSPLMLHNHTSVQIDPQGIMVFGGGGNCFSFGTHLNDEPFIIEPSL